MPVVRQWQYKGYKCYVFRVAEAHTEHHCGYAVLPPGHPDHGKPYDDIDVNVHGGLTYAQPGDEHAEYDYPGKPGSYTIGFDCSHYRDATHPDGSFCGMPQDDDLPNHYWTEEEVAAEVEQMVDQLGMSPIMRGIYGLWYHGRFWTMVRNFIHFNE